VRIVSLVVLGLILAMALVQAQPQHNVAVTVKPIKTPNVTPTVNEDKIEISGKLVVGVIVLLIFIGAVIKYLKTPPL